jgi:hypothetical protein
MRALGTSKTLWLTLLAAVGLAGVLCWQRDALLAWYHVRQLSFAYQEDRDLCARRVADLGEAALPRLLEGLCDEDALVCANMQAALGLMASRWGAQDARALGLVEKLHARFEEFSLAGQEKALLLLTDLLRHEPALPWPAHLAQGIGALVQTAEKQTELRPASLLLATALLDGAAIPHWADACRDMAERGLSDPLCGVRVSSVRLLTRDGLRQDKELLAKAVPLLHDPECLVRRVALLALAAETEIVREDTLMTLLHDPDAEVQYLCEQALRLRNLTDDGIAVARLITAQDPSERLRVLHILRQMPEVNYGEWLQRLSQDASPAVRAAAVRAVGENPAVDLSDRLREMAEDDPSETVRINAQYYLRQRVALRAMNAR